MKINAQDTLSLDEIEALKVKAAEADSLRAQLAQAREQLKAEKESFFKFIDSLPFFAYLQKKDYTIRFANRAFRESYGESAGRRCHQVIWGRETPCESCPTFRVFETKEPVCWESIHQDGKAFQVYDLPFSDSDGTELVLNISIDKTHCRRLERERSSVPSSPASATVPPISSPRARPARIRPSRWSFLSARASERNFGSNPTGRPA